MRELAVMDRGLQVTYCLYFTLTSAFVSVLTPNIGRRTRASGGSQRGTTARKRWPGRVDRVKPMEQ